jgi:hypothetical protein
MTPKEIKKLRFFGYGLAVISAFIGWRMGIKHEWNFIFIAWFLASAVFALMTVFNLRWIKLIYIPWMKVAHLIGNIINAILLSIMFFSVFSFVGIILRLMRKDLLNRSINRESHSYWIKRDLVVFDRHR